MAGPFEKIRPDQECLGDPLRFGLLRVRDPHPDVLPIPKEVAETRATIAMDRAREHGFPLLVTTEPE